MKKWFRVGIKVFLMVIAVNQVGSSMKYVQQQFILQQSLNLDIIIQALILMMWILLFFYILITIRKDLKE